MTPKSLIDTALDAAQRVLDDAVALEEAFNPSEYAVSGDAILLLSRALAAFEDAPESPAFSVGTTDDGLTIVTLRQGEHEIDLDFPNDGDGEFFYFNHATDHAFDTTLPADVGRYLAILFNVPTRV